MAIIRHTMLYESPELSIALAWDDEAYDLDLPSPQLWFRVSLDDLPKPTPGPHGWRVASADGIRTLQKSLERVQNVGIELAETRGEFERWWKQSTQGPPPGV